MGPLPSAAQSAHLPSPGFSTTLSPRSFSTINCVKIKPCCIHFLPAKTIDHRANLRGLRLRGNEPKVWLKAKPIKILSFKGRAQNGDGEPNSCKNTVQVSFPDKGKEAAASGFSEEVSASFTSKNQEHTFVTYSGVQTLVKKWILMLRTQSVPQSEKIVPPRELEESLETENEQLSVEPATSSLPKTALNYFLALDIAIKVPILLFIPGFLVVNIMHGAEVSKELTPLWVLGPLIVAFYVKLLQVVVGLYIFSIKQTIRIVKNMPSYCRVIYMYLSEGRLGELLHRRLWQPVKNVLNLNFREFLKQKLRQLKEAINELYLDFIESIWPHYSRAITFLKQANLM